MMRVSDSDDEDGYYSGMSESDAYVLHIERKRPKSLETVSEEIVPLGIEFPSSQKRNIGLERDTVRRGEHCQRTQCDDNRQGCLGIGSQLFSSIRIAP